MGSAAFSSMWGAMPPRPSNSLSPILPGIFSGAPCISMQLPTRIHWVSSTFFFRRIWPTSSIPSGGKSLINWAKRSIFAIQTKPRILIAIDNVLISDMVVSEQFVCDLNKCKGGCCEDGDAGAPLEKEELAIINEIFETVKPYLTKDGLGWIEKHGRYTYD